MLKFLGKTVLFILKVLMALGSVFTLILSLVISYDIYTRKALEGDVLNDGQEKDDYEEDESKP